MDGRTDRRTDEGQRRSFYVRTIVHACIRTFVQTSVRKTLNGRLPLKHSPYRPQTSAKHVSDDPRHFIFRPPKKMSGFYWSGKKVFCCFQQKSEELHTNGRHLQILHEKLRGLTICQLRTTQDASRRVDLASTLRRPRVDLASTFVHSYIRTKRKA